jgi:hypothetical protein
MIKEFLMTEASEKDLANTMLQFINSYEIRNGEFEGNSYIVRKMDCNNFIIFEEHVDQAGNKMIIKAFSIYRKELQDAIFEKAKDLGYEVNEEFLID